MAKCIQCGAETIEGASFCDQCGAKQPGFQQPMQGQQAAQQWQQQQPTGAYGSAPADGGAYGNGYGGAYGNGYGGGYGNGYANAYGSAYGNGYGQQAPNPYQVEPKSEPGAGLGIASLVIGIATILGAVTSAWTVFLGIPCIVLAVVGLVLAIVAKGKREQEGLKTAGKEKIGKVLNIIALALSVIAIVVTLAFGSFSMSGDDDDDDFWNSVNYTNAVESTSYGANPADDGVTIDKVEVGKSYDGSKIAYVTVSWTNNGDVERDFTDDYKVTVYQNGVELGYGIAASGYKGDVTGKYKSLKPGASTSFVEVVELDGKDDIEVVVTPFFSNDDSKKIAKTFKL